MRATVVSRLGDPAEISVRDVPAPEPSVSGVLIDVAAAGVGHLDLVCARGDHQLRPSMPLIPGFEVAGTVANAPDGTALNEGDSVMAYVDFGGCAEQVLARPELVVKLPPGIAPFQAAALPVNGLTALCALIGRAALQPSELVLVHGASGGVGMAAVQVARHLGAEPWAIVSNYERQALALEAGATKVFLADGDWVELVRCALGRRPGVDVVVDPVGGDRLAQSLRCTVARGRLVTLGFVAGVPTVPVNKLLVRNADLLGVDWDPEDPSTAEVLVPELAKMLSAGSLRAIGINEFALDEFPAVLAALRERRLIGKAVIRL